MIKTRTFMIGIIISTIILSSIVVLPTNAQSEDTNVIFKVTGYLKAPAVDRYNVNLTVLNKSSYYNIHLYVPSSADFDLVLVNNRTGKEVASSSDKYWSEETFGKDENIKYAPNVTDIFTVEIYAYRLVDTEKNITYSNEGNYTLVITIEKNLTIGEIISPWILPSILIIVIVLILFFGIKYIKKIIAKETIQSKRTKRPIIDDVNRFIDNITRHQELSHEIVARIIKQNNENFYNIFIGIKPDDLYANVYIKVSSDLSVNLIDTYIDDSNLDLIIRGQRKQIEKLLSGTIKLSELYEIVNEDLLFEMPTKKYYPLAITFLSVIINEYQRTQSIEELIEATVQLIQKVIQII